MAFNLFENELVRSMMFGTVDQEKLPGQIEALYTELSQDKNFNIQDLAGLAAFAPPEIQRHLQQYFLPTPTSNASSEAAEKSAASANPADKEAAKVTANGLLSDLSGVSVEKTLPGQVSNAKITKSAMGKRKYHNKSRKGCSTCKKRRVKCDEHRPMCNKCQHMGITCGYADEDDEETSSPGSAGSAMVPAPVTIPTFSVNTAISPSVIPGNTVIPGYPAVPGNSPGVTFPDAGLSPTINPTVVGPNIHSRQPSVTSPQHSPLPTVTLNGPPGSLGYCALNMTDLRLMYHYTTQVWPTITAAGISEEKIWSTDIPELAFHYPFLMHSILAFSATHLSRTEKGLEQAVTCHRGDALRLLREAVLEMSVENTDALVASALILIMDSLANASLPTSTSQKSMPASAWIFHVKGAATILTAVWPLSESSRFHKFISVDLGDLGDIMNQGPQEGSLTGLECFDEEIADMYPVATSSPYLITLAYMNKLHLERYKSDFILRVFAFPALLDKSFLAMLMTGDLKAMRIMRSYYKLLRNFTAEMKDRVWFLEGLSNVLPVNVEEYAGGGGLHMMLDFLGGGVSVEEEEGEWEMPEVD